LAEEAVAPISTWRVGTRRAIQGSGLIVDQCLFPETPKEFGLDGRDVWENICVGDLPEENP